MKNFIKLITLLVIMLLPLFANSVGAITALKGDVQIQRSALFSKATLGLALNESDSVITGERSKAQLIFNDETIVTIGKNSHFSIAKYVYDDTNEPVVEFGLIKGAMKTITGRIGKIAPQKFRVKTKTATIGIRGTNFVVIVAEDGTQRAYCTYGAISVSVNGKEYLVRQGFNLVLSSEGKVEIKEFDAKELQKMQNAKFGKRVALSDRKLDEDFRGQKMLDNTKDNISDLVVREVNDDGENVIQIADLELKISEIPVINPDPNPEPEPTLSELLAGYTMSSAIYSGSSLYSDGSPGSADLTINFGTGSASLSIANPDFPETVFKRNPIVSGIGFNVDQTTIHNGTTNNGTANGTFQEPKGNQVLGSFTIDEGYGSTSSGTYDVSTSQTLY